MKYYIATSTARCPAHNRLRDLLNELGHEITYDWTTHGSVRETTTERLAQVARAELEAIREADFVVVLLPGGKGTHTELGFSLAAQKKVFLHSEELTLFSPGPEVCAFYYAPEVTRFSGALEELAQRVDASLHQLRQEVREGELEKVE